MCGHLFPKQSNILSTCKWKSDMKANKLIFCHCEVEMYERKDDLWTMRASNIWLLLTILLQIPKNVNCGCPLASDCVIRQGRDFCVSEFLNMQWENNKDHVSHVKAKVLQVHRFLIEKLSVGNFLFEKSDSFWIHVVLGVLIEEFTY